MSIMHLHKLLPGISAEVLPCSKPVQLLAVHFICPTTAAEVHTNRLTICSWPVRVQLVLCV